MRWCVEGVRYMREDKRQEMDGWMMDDEDEGEDDDDDDDGRRR